MRLHTLFLILFVFGLCSDHLSAQNSSYTSNRYPGRFEASFTRFNATDKVEIPVSAGDIVFLRWTMQVSKGALSVLLKDKEGTVYANNTIDKNDTADLYITVKNSGTVIFQVQGKKADGSIVLLYEKPLPKTIRVETNSNIELFGLMMQLDNAPDALAAKDSVVINGKKSMWKDWYALAVKNYERFKAFDSCRTMQLYRKYLSKGIYNDYLIGFLLQASKVPNATLNSRMDDDAILAFSPNGNLEEAKQEATDFLISLNQFYLDTHFDQYLKDYAPYYTAMKQQVQKNLPSPAFIPMMERFYHKQFTAYNFVPGFTILNTMGFGKMNRKRGDITNVFGPFDFMKFDPVNPDPGFDFPEKIQNLAVHEFGHSFVNPAIDKLPEELIKATAHLYEPIREQMSQHAYTQWKMCLYEHFVKAGEICISRYMNQPEKATEMLNAYVKEGFIYLPFIISELEQYQKIPYAERDYDAFVVKVMERLREGRNLKI